jgi:hypothetical protein
VCELEYRRWTLTLDTDAEHAHCAIIWGAYSRGGDGATGPPQRAPIGRQACGMVGSSRGPRRCNLLGVMDVRRWDYCLRELGRAVVMRSMGAGQARAE